MPNTYVNKVTLSNGTTLIDLTSDTVTSAAHIVSGRIGHLADGRQVTGTAITGGTAAISVVDTTDSHGGTVRTITALDISDTTAAAADVAQGKYFYTAQGVKTAGTASGGTPSQTQHSIYFEFSDSTDMTITGYWNDSFISDAITATAPTTYGSKTVDLAQLDGVTWYEPANIPIGVELIDTSKLTRGMVIESSGEPEASEWYAITDYTEIDPSMTFTYRCNLWFYIGFYDSGKNTISALNVYNNATPDSEDGQVGVGTLNSSNIPSNAAYVRLTSVAYPNSNQLSLIRTA